MSRGARIAIVTVALAAIGAILGAAAGSAAFAIVFTASGFGFALREMIVVPAVIGAMLGAASLPLAGWSLLRRVPLGLVFLLSVAGTIAGGILGWVIPLGDDEVNGGLLGAGLGFLVAATAMWVATRRRDRGILTG